MSRKFSFTTDDQVGMEIEQYIYGKDAVIPAKGLLHMVLAQMSKNPLTVQQEARIKLRYGNRAIIAPKALSVNASGG